MKDSIVKRVIKEFKTPLYLYDYNRICQQYHSLKNALPDCFDIFYSLKANPLLGIGELFRHLGSGVEVASGGELYTAVNAGFSSNDIIFTSPGKTKEELEYAIAQNIYCINIESIEEAQIINEIAEKRSQKVNVSIRINPGFNHMTSGMYMSGISSQFGIEEAQLKEAFAALNALAHINMVGFSVYMGTQVLEADNLLSNTEEIIKLALATAEQYHFDLKYLNIGGGFGIPYFKHDSPLDMEKLSAGLDHLWVKYQKQLKGTRMIVESGRFLMADAALYLTTILYRKECKGNKYLICDGGSNHHSASAFLGRYIRDNFPIRILGKCGEEEEVTIAGPLCTPIDIIGQRVKIPKDTIPGDIVAVEKAGAYGLTNSPILFLSHSTPAEVMLKDSDVLMLRGRKDSKEFLNGQYHLF